MCVSESAGAGPWDRLQSQSDLIRSWSIAATWHESLALEGALSVRPPSDLQPYPGGCRSEPGKG